MCAKLEQPLRLTAQPARRRRRSSQCVSIILRTDELSTCPHREFGVQVARTYRHAKHVCVCWRLDVSNKAKLTLPWASPLPMVLVFIRSGKMHSGRPQLSCHILATILASDARRLYTSGMQFAEAPESFSIYNMLCEAMRHVGSRTVVGAVEDFSN